MPALSRQRSENPEFKVILNKRPYHKISKQKTKTEVWW